MQQHQASVRLLVHAICITTIIKLPYFTIRIITATQNQSDTDTHIVPTKDWNQQWETCIYKPSTWSTTIEEGSKLLEMFSQQIWKWQATPWIFPTLLLLQSSLFVIFRGLIAIIPCRGLQNCKWCLMQGDLIMSGRQKTIAFFSMPS